MEEWTNQLDPISARSNNTLVLLPTLRVVLLIIQDDNHGSCPMDIAYPFHVVLFIPTWNGPVETASGSSIQAFFFFLAYL